MAISADIEKLERRWMDNPTGLMFAPLAEALRKAGQSERALEILEAGLSQHPEYVPALIVRGRCHLDAGNLGDAEATFAQALGRDPVNAIALRGMAEVYERTGRLGLAIERLAYLLEVDRSDSSARHALERLRRQQDSAGETVAAEPALVPEEPAPLGSSEASGDEAAGPEISTWRFPEWAPAEAPLVVEQEPPAAPVGWSSQAAEGPPAAGERVEEDLAAVAPVEAAPEANLVPESPAASDAIGTEGIVNEMAAADEWAEAAASSAAVEEAPERRESTYFETWAMWASRVEAEPSPPEVELAPPPGEEAPAEVAAPAERADVPVELAQDAYDQEEEAPAPGMMEPWDEEPGPVEAAGEWEGPARAEEVAPMVEEPVPEAAAGEPVSEEPVLIATESMAELFLRQGHRDLALAVYRQLAERWPEDHRLDDTIARLEAEAAVAGGAATRAYAARDTGGESVESFLRGVLEAPPPAVTSAVLPPAIERGPSGDPTRPAGEPFSLASVFGGEGAPASIAGAEPAAAPPPVASAPAEPSYDEFFGGPPAESEATPAPGSPARPAEAEDLQQFSEWLKGLKR